MLGRSILKTSKATIMAALATLLPALVGLQSTAFAQGVPTSTIGPAAGVPGAAASAFAPIPGTKGDAALEALIGASSPAERKRLSKENIRLRHAYAVDDLKRSCAHRHGIIRETLEEYPSDWAAQGFGFKLAVEEELQANPQYWESFKENSILDPFGHMAMFGFTISKNLTEKALAAMGAVHDPCTLLKRSMERHQRLKLSGTAGLASVRVRASLRQRLFTPFASGIGMTVGAGVSSLLSDFLHDKDVRKCAEHVIGKTQAEGEGTPQAVAQAAGDANAKKTKGDEACDRMYVEWYEKGKINRLAPTLISTFLTTVMVGAPSASLQLLYEEAKRTRARTTSRIVLKGLIKTFKATKRLMSFSKVGFFIEFGHEVIFWWATKEIEPEVLKGYLQFVSMPKISQGIWQLSTDIEQLKQTNWEMPKEQRLKSCGSVRFDHPLFGEIVTRTFFPCTNQKVGEMIKDLGYGYGMWREAIMKEFLGAHQQWKNYAGEFIRVYDNAYLLYGDVARWVSDKALHKYDNEFYQDHPFESHLDPHRTILPEVAVSHSLVFCQQMAPLKRIYNEAQAIAEQEYAKIPSNSTDSQQQIDRTDLAVVIEGLKAADCTIPLTGFEKSLAIEAETHGKNESLQAMDKIKLLEAQSRHQVKAYVLALKTLDRRTRPFQLHWTLGAKPPLFDPKDSRTYSMENAFARIRQFVSRELKKEPEKFDFIQEPGQEMVKVQGAFHKYPKYLDPTDPYSEEDDANDDKNADNLDKRLVPETLGQAYTPSVADYFIASMVCGPEVDPTPEMKLAMLKRVQISKTALDYLASMPAAKQAQLADDYFMRIMSPKTNVSSKYSAWPQFHGLFEVKLFRTPFLGFPLRFNPPKLIARDIEDNLCGRSKSVFDLKVGRFNIYRSYFDIKGKRYFGMLDVIRNHLRPDIISTDGTASAFEKWWKEKVYPHARRVAGIIRTDFEGLVESKLWKPFTDTSVTTVNKVALHNGILSSVQEQIRNHLEFISTTVPTSRENAAERSQFETIRQNILRSAEYYARAMSQLRNGKALLIEIEDTYAKEDQDKVVLQARREMAEKLTDEVERKMIYDVRFTQAMQWLQKDIEKQLADLGTLPSGAAQKEQESLKLVVRKALISNLKGVTTEIGTYVQFMATLHSREYL